MQQRIREYMAENTCETCHGDRLRPEALAIHIGEKNIAEFNRMSIHEALTWVDTLTFTEAESIIARPILKEVKDVYKRQDMVGTASGDVETDRRIMKNIELYRQAIKSDYLFSYKPEDLETGIYKGLFWGLNDPYSEYYTCLLYTSRCV